MLTPEQQTLSEAIQARQPTSGRACAGTGKTTTAVSGLRNTQGRTLALAFNKNAATELAQRLESNPSVECRTLNSLGHRMLSKSLGHNKLKLEANKLRELMKAHFPTVEFEQSISIQRIARSARIAGIVPTEINGLKALVDDTASNWEALCEDNPQAEHLEIARELLCLSIREAQQNAIIDFDDQIYLSALNPNNVTGYDLVVVDEAQDLNPLQHKMLSKFYRTPLVIIGDPRQSIYGFRGATTNSMQNLEAKFSLQVLPLTLNFRCATEIINYAQQWCPEIRAGLSEAGSVESLDNYELHDLPPTSAVLSRCNAPLLRLAFSLIKAGRWPKFLGRDIGKSLASTLRLITKKKTLYQPALSGAIHDWFLQQITIAQERGQDQKVESLEDRRECLFAVLEQSAATHSDDLEKTLKSFAEQEGRGITLSSSHRAKGLEWPQVFWLDQQTNTRFAERALKNNKPEDYQQEQNIMYVTATRAKQQLFLINTKRKEQEA